MQSSNAQEFERRTRCFISLVYALPDFIVSQDIKETIVKYFIQNWFDSPWKETFTRERFMKVSYNKNPLLSTNNITERMNKSIDTIQFNIHLNRSITNLLVVVISEFLEAHNKEVELIENGEVNREQNFCLKSKIMVAKGLQLKGV